MWEEYNPNPAGKRTGDCTVRAVSKALGTDWDTAYCMLVTTGFQMKEMPSSNSVWGSVLKDHGYTRESLPDSCPNCYTAEDFIADHPEGTYILGFSGHTATLRDGVLYDAWNSLSETPQYFWYRKEKS